MVHSKRNKHESESESESEGSENESEEQSGSENESEDDDEEVNDEENEEQEGEDNDESDDKSQSDSDNDSDEQDEEQEESDDDDDDDMKNKKMNRPRTIILNNINGSPRSKKKKSNNISYNIHDSDYKSSINNANGKTKASNKNNDFTGSNATKKLTNDSFVNKIHSQFIVESNLSAEAKSQCEKIIKSYEGEDAQLVIAPNWTCVKPAYPLNGVSLIVDANKTRVQKIQFQPDKFHTSMIALRLDNVNFKNGEPVTLDRLIGKKDSIIAQMNSHIVGDNVIESHPSIECMHDINSTIDKKEWNTSLSTKNSSFLSICTSEERGANGKRDIKYWVVSKNTNKNLAHEAFDLIEEACEDNEAGEITSSRKYHPKNSFRNVFQANKSMTFLKELSLRHDYSLLYNATQAIDLDINLNTINASIDHNSKDKKYILKPRENTVEVITNNVTFDDQYAVYNCGTISTKNVKNGILFNENPIAGSVILKGRNPSTSNPYGTGWTNDSIIKDNAFPINTGRLSPYNVVQHSDIETIKSKLDTQYFTPTASNNISIESGNNNNYSYNNKTYNYSNITDKRLAVHIYRQRDNEFVRKQVELGYKFNSQSENEIHLRPLFTKINGVDGNRRN